MDLLDRLIHFPSLVRSIDDSVLVEKLLLYPFFGLLYILQSLRRQIHQIDEGKEFVPPVLANDLLFTWYKMSAISGKMEADVEIKQEVREEKPELVYPIINPSKSINPVNLEAGEAMPDDVIPESENEGDVRINDLLQPDLTGLGGDPEQDEPGYTGEKERQTIVTGYSKPRIIVNSIFKKEGMMPVAIEDFKYLNPDEEEVSGFARFLRQRTLKKEYYVSAPEKSEIESINNEGTELITVEEVITPAPDLIKDISGENKSGDYKKKKKKKKHLVDRLVKQSLLENELLVSEPFAELLYAQGYREKAIKIYEKLIVKFPEKKLIFAAKIDEINKENN